VRLRVSGVQDTEENAARLAAAKHLLEQSLRRPLLIEPVEAVSSACALRLSHRSPGVRTSVATAIGRVALQLRPVAGNHTR
jgi:hypothetical protein